MLNTYKPNQNYFSWHITGGYYIQSCELLMGLWKSYLFELCLYCAFTQLDCLYCVLIVHAQIRAAGFHVDIDMTDRTIQKKVREAQLAQFNYILVVGAKEAESGKV
ncbi:unnamed protein product [Triticum turgidum subsp. durum]|uniref:Anticodon-binding domain-containing protein n=1 Tax=Triticum turgidum subsp. durum TaxID=4567 RepID=A0A9R0VGV0_TRITD|nr:unnamed protein product [Triticum turgidum subsp. durum]